MKFNFEIQVQFAAIIINIASVDRRARAVPVPRDSVTVHVIRKLELKY